VTPIATATPRLTTTFKLVFGLGDWGPSAASTARNIFWFVFLTNVVGLGAGRLPPKEERRRSKVG